MDKISPKYDYSEQNNFKEDPTDLEPCMIPCIQQ